MCYGKSPNASDSNEEQSIKKNSLIGFLCDRDPPMSKSVGVVNRIFFIEFGRVLA